MSQLRLCYFFFFSVALLTDSLSLALGPFDLRCNELLLVLGAFTALFKSHSSSVKILWRRIVILYAIFFASGLPGLLLSGYSAGISGLVRSVFFPASLALSSSLIVPTSSRDFSFLFKAYLDASLTASTVLILHFFSFGSLDRASFPFYEPTQLAVGILPALIISIGMPYRKAYSLIFLLSIFLCKSTLVLSCLLLILAVSFLLKPYVFAHSLASARYSKAFLLAGLPLIVVVIAYSFYFLFFDPASELRFKMLFNSSFLLTSGSDLLKIRGTASSLLASFQSLIASLKINPLFGLGHGGTSIFFHATICRILDTCGLDSVNYYNSNGSNLTFRVLGDLGVLGISFFVFSVFIFFRSWLISLLQAIKLLIPYITTSLRGLMSTRFYLAAPNYGSIPVIWFHLPFIVVFTAHLLRKEALASFYLSFWMVVSLSAPCLRSEKSCSEVGVQ